VQRGRSHRYDRAVDAVDEFLRHLERFSLDDLSVLALPPPVADEQRALRERVVLAADQSGRTVELERAVASARDWIVGAFSFRSYEPTWFGLNWGRSIGRAQDRAVLIDCVLDAAASVVVADLLDDADLAALRDPLDLVVSMRGSAAVANPEIRGSRPRRAIAWLAWLYAASGWIFLAESTIRAGLAMILGARRQG
jgi:hypothetical protein